MINSIQHFCSEEVKNLEKIMVDYAGDMTKTAEMVRGVSEAVIKLGLSIIAEEWESYDELLRKRRSMRPEWYIVRRDETSLLTSLGSVRYHKTLFKNKGTGEYAYLLDRIMGIGKHVRMTEDAEAKILEEAVRSSYRKGGENAAITEEDMVSKETVMGKIQTYRYTAFPIRRSGRQRRSKTISGDCKKRKNCYSKERINLKHISGADCL